MFQQIKTILLQIDNFKLQDKVTQFNKFKNNQNKNSFNITEGRFLSILRNFKHFQFLQNLYGSAFLLSIGNCIEPYMIRKNKTLLQIKQKQANCSMEFIVTDGIIKVQKIQKQEIVSQSGEKQIIEKLIFEKYISDGNYFSLMEYPQNQYKLTSHCDSKLLRFPSKLNLDPLELLKKNHQLVKQMEKYQEFDYIKKLLQSYFRKKDSELQNFGLGNYDYNQLLFHMTVQKFKPKQTVINQKSIINRIGFLLNGKLIQEDKSKQKIKFVSKSNAILTLYKQDFTEQAKKLTTEQTVISEPQFINLYDFTKELEQNPFRIEDFQAYINEDNERKFKFGIHRFNITSSKQYWCFQECQIIWIPLQIFALKFNNQTLHEFINKWKAKIQLKRQEVDKQVFLKQITKPKVQRFQFQQKDSNNKPIQIFPKINHHQLEYIQQRGLIQSKVMAEKEKRLQKYKKRKNFQLQENSLLRVTMRKYPTIQELQMRFNLNSSQKGKQFSRKKQSFNSIISKKPLESLNQTVNARQILKIEEQQPIIMFPQKYKTSSLSPKLKKSLQQAQKQKYLFFNLKISKQKKKKRNNNSLNSIQSSQSLLFSNQGENNGLSTIQSRKSLSSSKISLDNPQQIYMGMIQKIAYKYQSLQELLKSYNKKRKHISPIKQRILQMKILQEIQKKKQNHKVKQKKTNQGQSFEKCKFPSLMNNQHTKTQFKTYII